MSDEQTTPASEEGANNTSKPTTPAIKLQDVVATKIAGAGQRIQDTVVDQLAQVEINSRVETVVKALKKQDELEANLKKINKNDNFAYVGGQLVESMTKTLYDNIEKEKQKIEKLNNALQKALTENTADSYNKLNEILNKG